MKLKQNQEYGTLCINFYEDSKRDIFITIDQLADGFGYKTKRGVERLIDRNPYLRDKHYSVLAKVHHDTGGTQETRLFNKRGTTEIGMLSRTKQGQTFRRWLYDYIEQLEQENYQFKIARAIEKPKRKELTDAIKDYKYINNWSYKAFTDLLLKLTTGMNAKQLKEFYNSDCSSLDLLTIDQHRQYYELENKLIVLIEMNFTYKEIKEMLTERVAQPC